jgi:hypothetical protein
MSHAGTRARICQVAGLSILWKLSGLRGFLIVQEAPASAARRKRSAFNPHENLHKGQQRIWGRKMRAPEPPLLACGGHFFPFGGGAFRCPGETLAKQVIFASVAMVLQSYELRLIDPDEARKIEPGHRELPFGLHSFDRPVPVEICKLSET